MNKPKYSVKFNLSFTVDDSVQLVATARELGVSKRELIRRAMRAALKFPALLASPDQATTS